MIKLFECVVNDKKSLHEHLKDGVQQVKYIGRGYVIARLDLNATIPFTSFPQAQHYRVYWTANKTEMCNGAIEVK